MSALSLAYSHDESDHTVARTSKKPVKICCKVTT